MSAVAIRRRLPNSAEAMSNPAEHVDSQAGAQQELPFALVYGQALTELPVDLYIPPDALEVFLEAFEGPLDLLLYLIRKQNFNILDIPLAQVTLQFLSYVDQIRNHNLEMASEYLLMAAMLIQIKSRMLLPQITAVKDEDGVDPRAELVRKLLEYEQIKLGAAAINSMPQVGRDITVPEVAITREASTMALPSVNASDLQRAWAELMNRAKVNQHHRIGREQLSVREHMTLILRKLKDNKFIEFADMFDVKGGVPLVVVHFVAMLELAKETLIEITQAEAFAPIYVRLAGGEA